MEINQQIFKAPLIPKRQKIGKKKLSKTTISSSVFTGALKEQVKLNKSIFSFIKPVESLADPAKLLPVPQQEQATQAIVEGQELLQKQQDLASNFEKRVAEEKKKIFTLFQNLKEKVTLKKNPFRFLKPSLVGDELSETNNILLDIQKQLELDYKSRIDEEKQELAAEKKKISRQRVEEKEAKIEKGGKGILGKTFEKVTAPFRSIFQKLIDFFSIILTGILLNTAFKWLSKEENRKKLEDFFKFIGEYWQELLIIFGAYKLAKLVGIVAGVALKIKKIVGWFKMSFGPKPPKPKDANIPTASRILSPAKLSRSNASFAKFIAGKSNIRDRLRLIKNRQIGLSGLFTKGGFNEAGSLRGQSLKLPKLPKLPEFKIPSVGGVKIPKLPAGVNLGNLLRILAVAESGRRFKEGDIMGGTLAGGSALPGVGYPMFFLDMLRSIYGKEFFDKTVGQGFSGEIGLSDKDIEKRQQGSALERTLLTPSVFGGMSQGGTVGQGDRPGKDTTPAFTRFGKILLDAGEEVIRTSSAMLFRPLLKDINDNAGRMWQAFSEAVKIQDLNLTSQFDLTKKFGEIIKNFKDYIESEIRKSKRKQIGEGTTPSPSPTPSSTPTPSQTPTSPQTPSSTPRTSPTQSGGVMPDASKPGALGDPKNPQSPKIGEQVGATTPPPPPTLPPSTAPSTTLSAVDSGEIIEKSVIEPPPTKQISPVVDEKPKNMDIWKKSNPLLTSVAVERERAAREITNLPIRKAFDKEYAENIPSSIKSPSFVDVFSKLKPAEEKFNNLTQKTFSGDQTTFINLPPKVTKLPKKQQPSGQTSKVDATKVPSLSAVDYSNNYNSLTLQDIGAVGYGNLYSQGIEALI